MYIHTYMYMLVCKGLQACAPISLTMFCRSWMQAKKITSRVEDLAPSEWFIARVRDRRFLMSPGDRCKHSRT